MELPIEIWTIITKQMSFTVVGRLLLTCKEMRAKGEEALMANNSLIVKIPTHLLWTSSNRLSLCKYLTYLMNNASMTGRLKRLLLPPLIPPHYQPNNDENNMEQREEKNLNHESPNDSVEMNQIEEQYIFALEKVLRTCTQLQSLRLTSITRSQSQELNMLKLIPKSVTKLWIHVNYSQPNILGVLLEQLTNLKSLTLSFSLIASDPESTLAGRLRTIGKWDSAIPPSNSLRTLRFFYAKLKTNALKQLILSAPALEHLELNFCRFNPSSIPLSAFTQLTSLNMMSLDASEHVFYNFFDQVILLSNLRHLGVYYLERPSTYPMYSFSSNCTRLTNITSLDVVGYGMQWSNLYQALPLLRRLKYFDPDNPIDSNFSPSLRLVPVTLEHLRPFFGYPVYRREPSVEMVESLLNFGTENDCDDMNVGIYENDVRALT